MSLAVKQLTNKKNGTQNRQINNTNFRLKQKYQIDIQITDRKYALKHNYNS